MLRFFRSDAWDLERVRSKWAEIVGAKFPLFEKAGHCFLVGAGTKQAKEGRHMPGVKKLAQESETRSKPEHLCGHHWGCAGVLIGREKSPSRVLLGARIHDGPQAAKDWDGSAVSGDSHVAEMMRDGRKAARHLPKDSLCLLDRCFPTVPALKELERQNAVNARKVDLVARMKLSAVACREAPETRPGQRGRKPRKGEKVRLANLFETERASFRTKRIRLYGKKQPVSYCSLTFFGDRGCTGNSVSSLRNMTGNAFSLSAQI